MFGKSAERCSSKLVRGVLHSDISVYIMAFYFRRPKDNKQLFSPNAEKYGPEKTPHLDTFHVVMKKVIQEIVRVMIFKYEEI